MRRLTLGGMALVLAALLGMVHFGSAAALALPATATQTNTKVKKTKPRYRIRTLPGLTGPGHKANSKAKEKAKKLEKEALQKQAFLGTISKKNGHYVLTAGIFTYKLNDQSQAEKFKGKKVRVTGKLNPTTNKIQVKKITKASGY